MVKVRHLLKGDARAQLERCLFPELELASLDPDTPKYGSVAFVDIRMRTADHWAGHHIVISFLGQILKLFKMSALTSKPPHHSQTNEQASVTFLFTVNMKQSMQIKMDDLV